MILLFLNGRLGNNLFQIAFGAILEKNTGRKVFFVPKSRNIGDLKFFTFFSSALFMYFPMVINRFWKMTAFIFNFKAYFFESQINAIQPSLNLKNASIHGYFQNSIYLEKNKDFLKELFKIREKYLIEFQRKYRCFSEGKRILTIQIRLGDYLNVYFEEISSKAFVGWEWFTKVLYTIELTEFDQIFLISDDVNLAQDNLLLSNSKIIVSDGREVTDFLLLLNSDVLVISNSSFAYWGAFLNPKPDKKVYAPFNWIGYNAGFEYPSKIMNDDFIWVK